MEARNIEQFGIHFMLDGYGAPESTLKNREKLAEMLVWIPTSIGMHTISDPLVVEVGPLNHKDPGGLSGFILIAESHLSFHTFPKRGFVTIDLYSCQSSIDTKKLTELFIETFDLKDTDTFLQMRGARYPTEDIYK